MRVPAATAAPIAAGASNVAGSPIDPAGSRQPQRKAPHGPGSATVRSEECAVLRYRYEMCMTDAAERVRGVLSAVHVTTHESRRLAVARLLLLAVVPDACFSARDELWFDHGIHTVRALVRGGHDQVRVFRDGGFTAQCLPYNCDCMPVQRAQAR